MTPIEEINHKGSIYEIKQDNKGRYYMYKIKYVKVYEDYIGAGETIADCRDRLGIKQLEFKL